MQVSMKFLADIPLWEEEKPYQLFVDVAPGVPRSNIQYCDHSNVEVNDIRPLRDQLSLDSHGIEFVDHQFALTPEAEALEAPENNDTVVMPTLVETRKFLEDRLRAEKVLCIDWRIRKEDGMASETAQADSLDNIRNKAIQPAATPHTDYSWDGGDFKVRQHLEHAEAVQYLNGDWKVRIINVWRALVPMVQDRPLAFCSCETVAPEDLIERDNVHPHNCVGSLYLLYRPHHRWFYLSEQRSSEVTVFVSWDADEHQGGPTKCCPHASFENPLASPDCERRKSLESRFIVITKREGRR